VPDGDIPSAVSPAAEGASEWGRSVISPYTPSVRLSRYDVQPRVQWLTINGTSDAYVIKWTDVTATAVTYENQWFPVNETYTSSHTHWTLRDNWIVRQDAEDYRYVPARRVVRAEDFERNHDDTWLQWTLIRTPSSMAPTDDPAELERRRVAAEQRRQQEIVRQQERRDALVRARVLLESILTPQQKHDLVTRGRFFVCGSRGRRYCIRTDSQSGNVDWVDDNERVLGSLCAHPGGVDGSVPDPDAWLAQMLALETDEDSFVRVANVHRGARPALAAA
jgi:hypothetical protein